MKQKKPAQKKPRKYIEPPKPERFLIQRTEIGVLVFNEYVEKATGQRDHKLTVIEEIRVSSVPKEFPAHTIAEFAGILPKKSKEAVAGAYESGVNRGRSGLQGGLLNLLGLGGIVNQINEMTSVLNMLDQKVYQQEKSNQDTAS